MGVEYEKLTPFCTFCQNIGHTLANCKRNSNSNHDDVVKDHIPPTYKDVSKKTAIYVPKNKDSVIHNDCSPIRMIMCLVFHLWWIPI